MKLIETICDIKKYYDDQQVVCNYENIRFTEPIFQVEHKKQVNIINEIYTNYQCSNVMEIACGPGRLTSSINIPHGVAIDSSPKMLELAKQKLSKVGKSWELKVADIFNNNFTAYYDFVFTFRFILHFKQAERVKIYKQAHQVLTKEGFFLFDALNKKKFLNIQQKFGEDKFPVYMKLYTIQELNHELRENNFRIVKLYSIQSFFWTEFYISRFFYQLRLKKFGEKLIQFLDNFNSKEPLQWVVLCQKI